MKSKSIRRLALISTLCMVACSFGGCSGADTAVSESAPATDSAETSVATSDSAESGTGESIKVGYIGSLTGDGAIWGQAGLNGVILAANEINAAGGILGMQVEIVQMDNRQQPVDSVNALKKLADDPAVVSVIGCNYSSCNVPMAPVAGDLKIPLIATTASNPKVTVDDNGNVHPYSFRMCIISAVQGSALANYAKNEKSYTKAAVITDSSDEYSTGLSDAFVEKFEELGGTIVAKELGQSADTDYRSQLSMIAAAEPEVLFIPWINKNVALIAKQAKELGIECELIGGDGWDSPEVVTLAGPGVLEGSIFTSGSSVMRPSCAKFRAAYEEAFGEAREAEAMFGYDALYLIADAAARANSVDRTALRDAIEATENLEGLTGSMTVDPETHNPTKPIVLNVIKDGKIEYLGDIAP